MGLDMYLNRKKYVGGYKVSITKSGNGTEDIDKVQYLIIEAGYWRKANAIHKWFVENVQDGEDDCKEYYVDENDLKKLLDVVNRVLEASKLVS